MLYKEEASVESVRRGVEQEQFLFAGAILVNNIDSC